MKKLLATIEKACPDIPQRPVLKILDLPRMLELIHLNNDANTLKHTRKEARRING